MLIVLSAWFIKIRIIFHLIWKIVLPAAQIPWHSFSADSLRDSVDSAESAIASFFSNIKLTFCKLLPIDLSRNNFWDGSEGKSLRFKISAYIPILHTCGTVPLQSASAGDYGTYMPMAYVEYREDNYIYFLVESASSWWCSRATKNISRRISNCKTGLCTYILSKGITQSLDYCIGS